MPIKDINELKQRLNLTDESITQIENVRNSEPARRVKSGGKNVPGFYPSKKMGKTIQFESYKLELAAIYEKEHDSNIIEYYDQPPSFKINYDNPEGSKKKKGGHRYTADFFVIEKDWIGWEEWKTEEELIELSEHNNNRYCVDENGDWRCPPCEEHAKKFGLSFRVRSSKEIDWIFQRNIRFLEDFLLDEQQYVSENAKGIIKKIIGDKSNIFLSELLNDPVVYSSDDIYTMIATGEIFVDIYEHLLVDFDKFPLFLNEDSYRALRNMKKAQSDLLLKPETLNISVGAKIQWDGKSWSIVNIGENIIYLLSEFGMMSDLPYSVFEDLIRKGGIEGLEHFTETEEERMVAEIIRGKGEEELAEANKRFAIVYGMLNGGKYEDYDVPERTIRDWVKKYKNAEKIYGNGYIGLFSRKSRQGNRKERFEKEIIELMNQFIEDDYETIKQKNRVTVYRAFKKVCKEKGYSVPSYKTFCEKVKLRPIHEQTKKRQGSKAAYNTEPVYYELSMTTPRHGDRPFEIAHIDHTILDIELICSDTGEVLGKPWVTFLVDAYSRRILAFYLTYDAPSYRSNMMVLRECVRRHSRLPDKIVVDGGKDFQSVYFDTLLARYKKLKQVRPGAKPRFGSICERLFGTVNTDFIHQLLGNTKIMKNVRQVTKDVNPKIHAVWTLEDLHLMLEEWCYQIYDNFPHSTLGESPKQAFVKRIAKTGERKNTYIKYDETFLMLTLPTTNKGTAKVIPGLGVKINYFYYWSEILLHPEYESTQVPVRYDPFNVGIAYAYINKNWVKLMSDHFIILENRTEKEMKFATAEVRKRNRLMGQKKEICSSQIVEFLENAESYEVMRNQQLKDKAVKNTFRVIEGGKKEKSDGTAKGRLGGNPSKNENNIISIDPDTQETQHKNILNKMIKNNSFQVYKEL